MTGPVESGGLRLDKWLWYARFYKSRGLAARICEMRRIRVNGVVVGKAHHRLRAGDVLTFVWNDRVRVIQVAALGSRRGPASEARTLYLELDAEGGEPGDQPCGDAERAEQEDSRAAQS